MTDEERFWAKVDRRGPDECWPWSEGTDDAGYGIFNYRDESGRRRKTRAHRWLLGHLRGKPLINKPVGLEDGCHHCDNPPCCNPAHLYVGTRSQNVGDAVERSRLWQLKKDSCPAGHEYDTVKASGARRCRKCENEQAREARRTRAKCRKGHSLTGDNVLLCKNGTRKCRTCDADRVALIQSR